MENCIHHFYALLINLSSLLLAGFFRIIIRNFIAFEIEGIIWILFIYEFEGVESNVEIYLQNYMDFHES